MGGIPTFVRPYALDMLSYTESAWGSIVGIMLCFQALVAQSVAQPPTSRPADFSPSFSSVDVEFDGGEQGGAPVRLAGTLLLPAGASSGSVPGVLLVTGSGAQDRDETIAGRKPFKVLATALASRGYAVLRYDDRGTKGLKIGQSTGTYSGSTLADFAEDAAAARKFLADRPEVDDHKIAICGHSTGGLEVSLLLGKNRIAGAAVLLAAPAVQGSELLAFQTEEMLNATHRLGKSGMTDEQIARVNAAQTAFFKAYGAGDPDGLQKAAEEAVRITLAIRAPGGADLTDEMMALGVKQALAPLQEKWMDHFLRYDPVEDLRASRVPVLAVFGGLDLQVAPSLNVGPVTAALTHAGNADSAVVVLPTGNHLFQTASTGLPAEYGALDDEMGPAVSAVIGDWLDRVLTRAPSRSDSPGAVQDVVPK